MDGRSRVLVVEDEAAMGRLLVRVLGEEGFEATLEERGETGLRSALEQRPDAVILDLGLPGQDGLDVCRELRAHGLGMPVIVLTARDAVPDRVVGLDAGADDYLVKPFAIDELLARLRSQLRRRMPPLERVQVADLVLEPATRLVRRAGREVYLTPHEFRMLELLMRHRRQVMTRDRILDHVWGPAAQPTSNVVEIYVHYLRRKLDDGRAAPLIRTVRNAGYVIDG